ncbi:hypothetical protein GYMLUDRAFT_39585 [Collybiopsis luxurians FD-317 M1]|nr:hypothetical protein GYMLUDRAFT_39585 [Collybiopsis luxurians FD-317 M1]
MPAFSGYRTVEPRTAIRNVGHMIVLGSRHQPYDEHAPIHAEEAFQQKTKEVKDSRGDIPQLEKAEGDQRSGKASGRRRCCHKPTISNSRSTAAAGDLLLQCHTYCAS